MAPAFTCWLWNHPEGTLDKLQNAASTGLIAAALGVTAPRRPSVGAAMMGMRGCVPWPSAGPRWEGRSDRVCPLARLLTRGV